MTLFQFLKTQKPKTRITARSKSSKSPPVDTVLQIKSRICNARSLLPDLLLPIKASSHIWWVYIAYALAKAIYRRNLINQDCDVNLYQLHSKRCDLDCSVASIHASYRLACPLAGEVADAGRTETTRNVHEPACSRMWFGNMHPL